MTDHKNLKYDFFMNNTSILPIKYYLGIKNHKQTQVIINLFNRKCTFL